MRSFPRRRAATLVDVLVAAIVVALCIALTLPALNAQNESARRHRCANNLMQIGLGIQNFHDIRLEICPSYLTSDAATYLPTDYAAWPILLLPFMEHANEYEAFDLTQPISQDVKTGAFDHAAMRAKSLGIFFCTARRLPPQLTADQAATVGDYGNVSYGLLGDQLRVTDPAKPQSYNGAMTVCRAFNPESKPKVVNGVELGTGDFRALTNFASVIDGLSNTAFIGEKAAHKDRLGRVDAAGTHQDGNLAR